MSSLEPFRSSKEPIPRGTHVQLDGSATFLDRDYLVGGSPWRLVRLPGASRAIAERWKDGDVVRAGEERFARTLINQGLLRPIYIGNTQLEDVDIIIPVRDNVEGLEALLAQVSSLQVTVVDDASHEPAMIRECTQRHGAKLVRLESNVGAGGARNAGAQSTTRPFLCFIDDDVSIEDAPFVLSHLLAQFHDVQVGACAPRVRGSGGSSMRDRFEQRFCPLDMGDSSSIVVPGASVSYVPSACLMVRREAFGVGFDETLRTGEDVDFVWRAHDHGWLVRYVAEVQVTHRSRRSWPAWWRQRVGYGASASELARRHGERLAPVRTDVWTLLLGSASHSTSRSLRFASRARLATN